MSKARKPRARLPRTGPRPAGWVVQLPDGHYLRPGGTDRLPHLWSNRAAAESCALYHEHVAGDGQVARVFEATTERMEQQRDKAHGLLHGFATSLPTLTEVENRRRASAVLAAKKRTQIDRDKAERIERKRQRERDKKAAREARAKALAERRAERKQLAAARRAKGTRVRVTRTSLPPHLAATEGPPGYTLPLGWKLGGELPRITAGPIAGDVFVNIARKDTEAPELRVAGGRALREVVRGAIRKVLPVGNNPTAWTVDPTRVQCKVSNTVEKNTVSPEFISFVFGLGPGPRITDDAARWKVFATHEHRFEHKGQPTEVEARALLTDGARVVEVNAVTLAALLAAIPAPAAKMHAPELLFGQAAIVIKLGAHVVAAMAVIEGDNAWPPPKAKRGTKRKGK